MEHKDEIRALVREEVTRQLKELMREERWAWLSVADVSKRSGRHEVTVRVALNDGKLHGVQREHGTR